MTTVGNVFFSSFISDVCVVFDTDTTNLERDRNNVDDQRIVVVPLEQSAPVNC